MQSASPNSDATARSDRRSIDESSVKLLAHRSGARAALSGANSAKTLSANSLARVATRSTRSLPPAPACEMSTDPLKELPRWRLATLRVLKAGPSAGSASAGSIPAASISPARWPRLVPRTAQPVEQPPPSPRPRQPQPTISARAIRALRSPRRRLPAAARARRVPPPRRARISFCASTISRKSSISFSASTWGERVGCQSTRSALLPPEEVPDDDEHADEEEDDDNGPEDEDHGEEYADRHRQPCLIRAVTEAYVVDAVRTPMGSYRGALSGVRPDDLAAHTIAAVVERSGVDPERIVDVYLGAANQSGEDNRDVARMAALLAGLPDSVPGATVNRLCASGLEAINCAARAVKLGEGDLYLAGGVESMSRAPWVVEQARAGPARGPQTMHDTTLGWRLVNPRMAELGVSTEAMGETGENVAERFGISREDQDAFGLRSHQRAVAAAEDGRLRRGDRPDRGAEGTRDGHSSRPTRGRGPTPRWRRWRSCARSSARAAPSPPATPRPSTTAPPAR